MGLYEELKSKNYVEVMLNDIARGNYAVAEDDSLKQPKERMIPKLDSPWIWSGFDKVRLCTAWQGIYFSKYKFISRNCFHCWKIVLRLDKITTLFKVLELQTKMNKENPDRYFGKCGLETRPYATYKGRYAAFWYCSMEEGDGLEEAIQLAREVEDRVQKDIATGLRVILKRACTEMEERFGPSNLWNYAESHHEVEDKLDELIDIAAYERLPQPKWLVEHIKTVWIERAFETNDKSVKEMVDHFPASFGIAPTVDYYRGKPKIVCENLPKGKTNAGTARIQRI